ncbi:MAG: hypothetical protein ACTSPG_08030 [Candidatus Hodarchaeales archaeon]
MTEWDLIIYDNSTSKNVVNRFRLTERLMDKGGQHGRSTILVDSQGKEWLLKIFNNLIDFELKELHNLEVDIHESPERNRKRMHLWRILNELTASRLAQRLNLNVPKVIVVCSQQISDFPLKSSTTLFLGDVVIFTKAGAPETADEYYHFSDRDPYIIKTSSRLESLFKTNSLNNDPRSLLALLIEKIPSSINLDQYIDSFGSDIDSAFETLQFLDDGYFLLPFDIWLNDPDRNAGNYLVELNEDKKAKRIFGIDYEMWALGSDIWMEEDKVAKGRSYLTAIIHGKTDIFDPRINQTVFRIRELTDEELNWMTRAPQLLCKFFEYHIGKNRLDPDERIRLREVEINLEDFLTESRPRPDKLSSLLVQQIGLPEDF